MKALFALLLTTLCPIGAFACSCPAVEHACQVYGLTPIIFTGTVVGLGTSQLDPVTGFYTQTIQFEVNERFKGTEPGVVTAVREHVRSTCPSGAPEFAVGGKYLVWAFPDDAGNAVISDCTLTRSLEEAAQFISELRELRAGQGASYIFGDVYRNRIFPNGVKFDELENYSDQPLPGTRVTVSSEDGNSTVLSDKQGHFVVPLERGGNYRVVANLPSYFRQEGLDREFDLEDHQCVDASVWTQYAFPFRGRILDAHGVPIAGAPVELLSASKLESFVHSFTDSSGRYELSASEPGDYIIAANWDEAPSEEAPFATALYPGVSEIDTASVVHADEAGPAALSDFHLIAGTRCTVKIHLEDASGNPAHAAKILTKYFPEQFWHPLGDVDSKGNATITLIVLSPAYLVASQVISDQQEFRSDMRTIRSCPREPIRLRLTHTLKIE
jgi:hypothetical protein